MLIPLQSFTHIWLTLTLTTFLRALDKHLFPRDWTRGTCICFIILQSLCDVHRSMSRPLLSFWFNVNHFICFIGWLVLSEKMKCLCWWRLLFSILGCLTFHLHSWAKVDFPVWCGTRCPFVRKLQMSSPQNCVANTSPENRAHFPPSSPNSVTGPLPPDSVPSLRHNLTTNA